jgi:hypothetical protein
VVAYLNASSERPLLRAVELELLAAHEQRLLEKEGSGIAWMLQTKRKEDLSRMYACDCVRARLCVLVTALRARLIELAIGVGFDGVSVCVYLCMVVSTGMSCCGAALVRQRW